MGVMMKRLLLVLLLCTGCAHERCLVQDDWYDFDEARDAAVEECYTEHPDSCFCADGLDSADGPCYRTR